MSKVKQQTKAVFFDRDGVLNNLVERDGHYYSPQTYAEFQIVSEAEKAIEKVKQLGYLVIVISNQPDITRGKMKQSELDKMTQELYANLNVDDVIYCTNDDHNDTGCRKPNPGMFYIAQEKFNIDLEQSFMIGDTWKDVEAAKNANIPMILLRKKYNIDLTARYVVDTLLEGISIVKNGLN